MDSNKVDDVSASGKAYVSVADKRNLDVPKLLWGSRRKDTSGREGFNPKGTLGSIVAMILMTVNVRSTCGTLRSSTGVVLPHVVHRDMGC